MVLHDVTDGAGLLVEGATLLDPERLGNGDLDARDGIAVPDAFEDRVAEAEDQEVLDCLLAEVVVDAEDPLLGKDGVNRLVERTCGREVMSERLLDDQRGSVGEVGFADAVDQRRERGWGNCQVDEPALPFQRGAQVAQLRPGVQSYESQPLGERVQGPRGRPGTGVAADRLAREFDEPRLVHLDRCGADDVAALGEQPLIGEVEQRGEQLSSAQVTAGPDHDNVLVGGRGQTHREVSVRACCVRSSRPAR